MIVGQSGSGKSWFGVWLLSHASYHRRPWIVVDYKRETLFQQLGRHAFRGRLTPSSVIPRKPGLYHLQPLEGRDDDAMDDFLWRVWVQGQVGLYFDEGTMVPAGRGSAFRAIQTSGRSLKIPTITCSQRPVEIDRYAFSEAQYYARFFLQDRDDRLTLKRYTPFDPDLVAPEHHCHWYDSRRRQTMLLTPVPDCETFLERIRNRAPRRFWFD